MGNSCLTLQNKKVDRLPAIALEWEKIKFWKFDDGTGKAIAQAVDNALQEHLIKYSVHPMCFDTTASNTGHLVRACIILEQLLEKFCCTSLVVIIVLR